MFSTLVRQNSSIGSVPRSPNSTPADSSPSSVRVRTHADAEQHVRAVQLAAVLQHQPHALAVLGVDGGRPAVLDHVHAAAQEHLLQHLGQVGVVVGQDLVARRHQRDTRAAAREEVRELAAGRPRAQHHQVLGQVAQVEHLARGQHAVAVGARERRHERERRRCTPAARRTATSMSWSSTSTCAAVSADVTTTVAGQHADVHAIHALAHAAALVQRDGAGAGQRAAQVDLAGSRARSRRPSSSAWLIFEHRVGRRQQRLGRDRVGHGAVAAELVVLDQGDLGAEVGGGGCGGVPGRSAT